MTEEQKQEKMERQDKKINDIWSEMTLFKTSVNGQFEDIRKLLEPIFTKQQSVGLVFSALGLLGGIMLFVTDMKSDTRNNTTELKNMKEIQQLQMSQYQDIMSAVSGVKTDIEVIKAQQELKRIKK